MRRKIFKKSLAAACLIGILLLPASLLAGTMGMVHQGVDTAQDVDRAVSGSSHEPVHQGVDTAQDVARKVEGTTVEGAQDAAEKEAVNRGANALGNILQ